MKPSKKLQQALELPNICNINPRSIYNKQDEFREFVNQESIQLIFMSESWERKNLPLDKIINLENYEIISNVSQRKGPGGRPAIIANSEKYHIQNITNTLVQIPWGVEAVWCILTPKNTTQNSVIQKIACCALYCKPGSKKKTLLLDHISDAFNVLSSKYGRGLHFIIAGDTNDLNLDPILNLSSNLQQIVKKWTRMNPPALLDPIITTLAKFYQEPLCLEPLDSDPDKNGVKSDHKIVIARPINVINNKCGRKTRIIKFRPFTKAGLEKMKDWFIDKTWDEIYEVETSHEKAKIFQDTLLQKMEEFFPQKTLKINSDDQPWMNSKLKKLDRQRKRIYRKERRSAKWHKMDKLFKNEMKSAKSNFYKKSVADLKLSNPSKWYACLKRITSHDQHKSEELQVENISHLSSQEQAEVIAEQFSSIQNEYDEIRKDDIQVPYYTERQVWQLHQSQVWFALSRIATNKSTVPGDFPAKLIKHFAAYLAEPLTHIFNTSIKRGEYPEIYKFEICTPVPKVISPQDVTQLRNISGLLNFDKIFEKLLAQVMIADMQAKMDPSQYGNNKGISIQHYLINMIHRILTVLDNNSRGEQFAVIANLIDWNNAFPRQCPTLGVKSFIQNGVRPSLIPLLMNYFEDRVMSVKWHGCRSVPRRIKGGGPQGATVGILEYLAQSNNNADCVSPKDRFKFLDDLSVLEIVNLLTIGLASYNVKVKVPSDIPGHNQFIPSKNLKSQEWLDNINEWTVNQKMMVNEKKTKTIIFNFTHNYQFTTKLSINNKDIEVIDSTRLLGTIIQKSLKWDLNIAEIVRKANARMEILRRVSSFGSPIQDLRDIYVLFVRSLLEQSATVWHSSITQQNSDDLERVQKNAFRIILKNEYKNYTRALRRLDMEKLCDRREKLCLNFAKKCVNNPKTTHMFPKNIKLHDMKTRNPEKFLVQHALNDRLKRSPIIYMQNLLNSHKV